MALFSASFLAAIAALSTVPSVLITSSKELINYMPQATKAGSVTDSSLTDSGVPTSKDSSLETETQQHQNQNGVQLHGRKTFKVNRTLSEKDFEIQVDNRSEDECKHQNRIPSSPSWGTNSFASTFDSDDDSQKSKMIELSKEDYIIHACPVDVEIRTN